MNDAARCALIMAAGRGSRLGSVTDDRPKGLVDLGGLSALDLQIDVLLARGIERFVVVTGYRRDMIETAVERRIAGRAAVEFAWNPFWSATNVLGSAWVAREQIRDAFVYLHADTVFDASILDDLLASRAPISLAIDFRACEPEQMKADVTDGKVTHLSKALPAERTAGEFIGIASFLSSTIEPLLDAMDAVMMDGGLSEYFEAAINRLIADSGVEVRAVPTLGRPWTEIDFVEDLDLARSLLPALLRSI